MSRLLRTLGHVGRGVPRENNAPAAEGRTMANLFRTLKQVLLAAVAFAIVIIPAILACAVVSREGSEPPFILLVSGPHAIMGGLSAALALVAAVTKEEPRDG